MRVPTTSTRPGLICVEPRKTAENAGSRYDGPMSGDAVPSRAARTTPASPAMSERRPVSRTRPRSRAAPRAQREARLDGPVRAVGLDVLALDGDRPRASDPAEQGERDLLAPRAGDTGDADDLTRSSIQVHAEEHVRVQVAGPEDRLAFPADRVGGGEELLE